MAQQDDPYAYFNRPLDDSTGGSGGEDAQLYSSYEPPRMEPPPADRGFVDRITSNYDPIIERAAQVNGVDPRLLKGLIDAESTRNPNVVSSKGARGLGQIMPATAALYGVKDPALLDDPETNINLSARILADSLDWAKGDTRLALRHYNGGPNTKIWGKENEDYPDRVLSRAMRYNAPDEWDSARGFREGLVGTAADWYGESARKNLRAGNVDAATQDLLQSYQGQQYISDHALPQDQLSEMEGPGDLLTSAMHSIGSGVGTSLPALGYAGAGAAAGSVLGPLGAIGGGLAGGAYGLMHQMSGNTLRGAVDEILNGTPATEENVRAALAKLKPEDLSRIENTGMLRGGLELIPEIATGGLAKILPVGKAVDLLSKPVQKVLGAGAIGAAQEMADVPLEAYGTRGDYTGKDLINAAGAGFFGEGGIVAGSNPRGVGAQIRGLTNENYRPQYMPYAQGEYAQGNEPLTRREYARQYYDDRGLREKTRVAMDAQRTYDAMPSAEELAAQDAMAQQAAEQAQRAAEPPPLPTFKELKAQMDAEYQAAAKAAQAPKVTQEDLDNAVEQYLMDNPEAEAVPAYLNDLKTFRRYQADLNKSKNQKPKAPTNQDVYARLKQLRKERQLSQESGPWVRKGDNQLDMFGEKYGRGTAPPAAAPEGVEAPTAEVDPRQMELDYGRSGYEGQRLLTRSGDIFAGQEPEQGTDGQLDMFGGRGPEVTPEDVAAVEDTSVDPRQESLRFPANDAASGRRFDAAFNQAEREAARQKARDEEAAGNVTRQRNVATAQARQEVAGQSVPAEESPDLGLKRRQIRALNKAEVAAAEQAAKAEEAKAAARETFVSEANAAIGPDATGNPQIRPDDILNEDGRLFPKSRRGRAGKGLEFVDITDSNGAVVGRVKRAKAAVAEDVGPNADQIIAQKLAEQENLLAEKDAKKAKPKAKKAQAEPAPAAVAETTDADVDALIKKIESIEAKQPAAKGPAKAEPVDMLSDEEILRTADQEYASIDGMDETDELDFGDDRIERWDAGDTEFFSVKPGKPARGVRRSVADTAVAPFMALAQTLGIQVKVFDNAQQALGPNANVPAGTKGAYWPKSRIVGVFADAADSVSDIETTLVHEIFGHFGLNTFSPADKRAFLERIAQSKDVGSLKAAFAEVARDQPDLVGDDLKMAEEVFARASESIDSPLWRQAWNQIRAALTRLLRGLGLVKGQMSEAELRVMAQRIADGIRKGQRQQQNFPASDAAQFRNVKDSFENFVDNQVKPGAQGRWDWANGLVKDLVVSLNDIAYLARWRSDLKSLQKIHQSEMAMQKSYNKMADSVMAEVDNIRALPREVQRRLYSLMLDATRTRIHPDQPFNAAVNSHLKEADKPAYDTLRQQFEALRRASPAAIKAFADVRDSFESMHEQRKQALYKLADRIMTPRKAAEVKQTIKALTTQSPGPYFPLVRFGSHVAVWKSADYLEAEAQKDTLALGRLKQDPTHYQVAFEDSQDAAWRQVRAWREAAGDTRTDAKSGYAAERNDYLSSVNQSLTPLLQKMQESIEVSMSGATKKDINEAKDALAVTFFSSLPDTSIFMNSLKRENVSGVKPEQMLQAIARHGGSQAFHISRLEHASDIQAALEELRDEDIQAMNKGEKYSVYGTVARGLNGMFNQDPTTGWGSVGRSVANTGMGVLYYSRLALNPAFWVTSAMSPGVISMPYMTARHKIPATYRAWGEAMKDAVKVLTPKSVNDYMRFSFGEQIEKAGFSKGEAAMLQAVADAGGIDQSQIRELNDIARNNIGMVDDAKRFMAGMAHRAEVMSRLSTALAAYRLEMKKNGGDQDAATKYAIEVVDNTLINYTHAHTPFILRNVGPTQKVLMQFARYQIGMGQLILHNFREAFGEKVGAKPVSPEVREDARKKFYALLTAHSLATGTSGLFGLSLLNFALQGALSMFYPDDDEPDLEQKTREMLDAALGKSLSTVVRKGLPAAAGLDLSGRMGLQDMLNVRRDNPFSGDRHKMKENAVNAIPALSHAIDWMSWAKDPKTKTFPVAFISNIAKGADLYTNGMTNTHGVVKKGAEDYSFGDVLLQGMGFTPTESTEAYARQDADRRSKEATGTTRQALLDDLYSAMRSKDKARIASVREQIKAFSDRHKGDKKAAITQATIDKSFQQRKKREQGMDDYGIAP